MKRRTPHICTLYCSVVFSPKPSCKHRLGDPGDAAIDCTAPSIVFPS